MRVLSSFARHEFFFLCWPKSFDNNEKATSFMTSADQLLRSFSTMSLRREIWLWCYVTSWMSISIENLHFEICFASNISFSEQKWIEDVYRVVASLSLLAPSKCDSSVVSSS